MKFNTAECFLLISLDPEIGRFIYSNQQINFGLIGSILFDLAIYEKIEIEDQILTFRSLDTNGPITSELNNIICKTDQPKKVKYWINKFIARSPQIKKHLLGLMESKDVISIEQRKLLGIFSNNKYWINDLDTRQQRIRKLRDCVLSKRDLYTENVALLALLEACKMYKVLSNDKKELKVIKSALKEMIKENPIALSVANTLKDLQSALVASITAATISTTVATN